MILKTKELIRFFFLSDERDFLLKTPADADQERRRQGKRYKYLVLCKVWCRSCWEKERLKNETKIMPTRTTRSTKTNPLKTTETISLDLQPPVVSTVQQAAEEIECDEEAFKTLHGDLASYEYNDNPDLLSDAEARGEEGASCVVNIKVRMALAPRYTYPARDDKELNSLSEEALRCFALFSNADTSSMCFIWPYDVVSFCDNMRLGTNDESVVDSAIEALLSHKTRTVDFDPLVGNTLIALNEEDKQDYLDRILVNVSKCGSLRLVQKLVGLGAHTKNIEQETGSHPEFACLTSPHGRELLEYFVKEVGVDVIAPYATVDHLRYIEKNQTIVDECISYGYCDALQYCLQECNVPVTMHLVQKTLATYFHGCQVETLRVLVKHAGENTAGDNFFFAVDGWQKFVSNALRSGGNVSVLSFLLNDMKGKTSGGEINVTGNMNIIPKEFPPRAGMSVAEMRHAMVHEEGFGKGEVAGLDVNAMSPSSLSDRWTWCERKAFNHEGLCGY